MNEQTRRRIGYARVSTDKQDESLQLRALDAAGVDSVYVDHGVSGAMVSRPRLNAMLTDLRQGDTVVVYSLSRLSRGTAHLLELADGFSRSGVDLVSLNEAIDTGTPMGRFTYTVFAALTTMEREQLAERTRDGLEAARARGQRLGRPPRLSPEQIRHGRLLHAGGEPYKVIAESLGCSESTARRALARE
ncbi:recombinase family protein [Tsukamurella ocularis]|uniref:recombinase family protein n=1 Tax=Tsukamurella ocularis TaxID=1970234 RepID=UPI00216A4BA8|nr:recombinase family protein [Tsukamurella ocularis]MCS3782077.1 DNA invertase Pin-like site-specific DNA recombinase [Tsukamurella ocularis]MCS3788571.1 DNA invertase Pin-like site-specific DNA recombinase [Tsukamurella ocularis]MCS3852291.1 DNA invertase Pin-like site-specific DNA recombinase [Tsukamurella ocularis]